MKKYLALLFALALASLGHAQPYVTVAGATFPATGNLAVGVKANGDPIAFLVDATGILQTATSGGSGGGGATWVAPPSITVGGYSLLANGNMASGVTAGGVVVPILCDDTGKVVISGGGGGSGTVTVVGSGSLTSTALVTGGGTTTLQTPAATATMDSSGNISTPGGVTTGAGGSAAGYFSLGQGTAASTGTTNITFYAPTSVTSYKRVFASTVGSTGFPLYTVSGTTQTESLVAGTGTGNVVRSASPTLTGVPLINNATASNPAVITDTLFHVTAADSTQNLTLYDSFGAQGKLAFRVAAGTSASPSAVQVDTVMAEINVRGYQTTGYAAASGANMLFVAHQNFTDSAQGTYVRFQICPDNTNTRVNALSLYGDSVTAHLPLVAESTLNVTGVITGISTTQTAGDNSTKLATTAYADKAARATNLGTFASPNTAAGAITWTSPVYNIYTSAASTRTYTLPAASSYTGQAFILNVAVGTGHVNVQPASGAQLVLAGVLLTANHYVQAATSAPGNYICFISDGTNWCSLGSSGTWADAASP